MRSIPWVPLISSAKGCKKEINKNRNQHRNTLFSIITTRKNETFLSLLLFTPSQPRIQGPVNVLSLVALVFLVVGADPVEVLLVREMGLTWRLDEL